MKSYQGSINSIFTSVRTLEDGDSKTMDKVGMQTKIIVVPLNGEKIQEDDEVQEDDEEIESETNSNNSGVFLLIILIVIIISLIIIFKRWKK